MARFVLRADAFSNRSLHIPERTAQLGHRLFEFAKQRATVQQVENFVVDDTPFFATHYRKVLVELESDGGLNYLKSPAGRRSGTYADKMVLLEFS